MDNRTNDYLKMKNELQTELKLQNNNKLLEIAEYYFTEIEKHNFTTNNYQKSSLKGQVYSHEFNFTWGKFIVNFDINKLIEYINNESLEIVNVPTQQISLNNCLSQSVTNRNNTYMPEPVILFADQEMKELFILDGNHRIGFNIKNNVLITRAYVLDFKQIINSNCFINSVEKLFLMMRHDLFVGEINHNL